MSSMLGAFSCGYSYTCVSPEKTLLISSWNTGLAESTSQQEGRGRALLSPEIIFLNSISNLSDFPVVPSGSDANRDNSTALQQVNRADGSQRVVTPQDAFHPGFALWLLHGAYFIPLSRLHSKQSFLSGA